MEKEEAIRYPRSLPEIVEDDRGASTRLRMAPDESEDEALLPEIQVRDRLVEEPDGGALRQGPGDPDPLPLASREPGEGPPGKGEGRGLAKALLGDPSILGPIEPKPTQVGAPSHQGDFQGGEGEVGGKLLRQEGQFPRHLPPGAVLERLAVEEYAPAGGGEQTGQDSEETALPGSVGAHDPEHLALAKLEIDSFQDAAAFLPIEAHSLGQDPHGWDEFCRWSK